MDRDDDDDVTRPPDEPDKTASPKLVGEPAIDRPSQNRIGDHLRAMYDGLMQQPVPDRFVELLNQLETRPAERNGPRG